MFQMVCFGRQLLTCRHGDLGLSNTPEAYKEFQLLNHGLFFSGLVVFCFIFKPHIRFNFDNLSQSWSNYQ